jgi:SAM-dependent methyltransferase
MPATIEQVRDFWNARPCNIRGSDKPIGSLAWFQETETRKYFVEPHIPAFADFLAWKDKQVLEIGCGTGVDTINFVRAGADIVVAVDLSEESLSITNGRLHSEALPERYLLELANAEDLNWLPQTYDLIYAFGSIHHSPHPDKILLELRKHAERSTSLRIMVYNKFSWKVLWIFLKYGYGRLWKLDELVQKYSEAQTGCPVTHTYSKKSVTELLNSTGWDVKSIKIDHIFPYSIPAYKRHQFKKVWYFRWMPKKAFRWLETHFGWHLLIEAVPK